MKIAILVCVMGLCSLVWVLRRGRLSLGLPIAYLGNLLLIHVPGAIAHVFDRNSVLTNIGYTRTGIILTAIGTGSFVMGVALTHINAPIPLPVPAYRGTFYRFALLGGGIVTVLSHWIRIPSIGAVLERGGPIWMVGTMLALRSAFSRNDWRMAARWLAALGMYPLLILLLNGFLSYGAAAAIIVISGLAVTARSYLRVAVTTVIALAIGISVFLSYFQHRSEIRGAVWGHADTEARISASMAAIRDLQVFDPSNPAQLDALDQRLNQNYFVGLAASRIDAGEVQYLHGRSLWEGVLALVPRALWPDKPVVAGSPKIVAQMTGLNLSEDSSFGVGNVMEFDINFGMAGVIIGFLLFGVILGKLDREAAIAEARGDFGALMGYFLPAVAIIQPNGSIVEIASGGIAAVVAAYGWKKVWDYWSRPPQPAAVYRQPARQAQ